MKTKKLGKMALVSGLLLIKTTYGGVKKSKVTERSNSELNVKHPLKFNDGGSYDAETSSIAICMFTRKPFFKKLFFWQPYNLMRLERKIDFPNIFVKSQ